MILDTAEKLFKYFLQEVRKERTVVITPQAWTEFINPVILDWVKTKLPELEFNQKRIDDLEAIKVLTDGGQYPYIRDAETNVFVIPYSTDGYPSYLHGLSAEFGYISSEAEDDGQNDEQAAQAAVVALEYRTAGIILRSDNRVVRKKNPYRQPDDDTFIYFENRGGRIYSIPKEKEYNQLVLEYYRYPEEITFDGTTGSTGSFMPTQNKEIMDLAVVQYLEVVESPRLQTAVPVKGSIPK